VTIEVVSTLASVEPADWNRLAADHPFLRHEFLSALHETGCAAAATGWAPQYLLLREGGRLAGAFPLYLKTHSYGEYVFDWAWADAYRRHGRNYYPKLLSAVPFTPVTGHRLLADTPAQRAELLDAAMELARKLRVSSMHILFPFAGEAAFLAERGLMLRNGVQFHWTNHGYRNFDEFLAVLNHDKRKKIRQERRKVREADISFTWLEGKEIAEADWQFFIRCYQRTYAEHRSSPYLNLEFFTRIGQSMPENLVLIVARRGGRPIAASFNVRNRERLFGRYWGALEHHPALHFEACYYQVIEYCIARGLAVFEGGAQGEHKMSRGLMPVETFSAHWLADPAFAAAVEEFLGRETRGIGHYLDELGEHSPFRHAGIVEKEGRT
jgi:predicted N-acyltransferase